jgi:hypothetical protein
MQHYVQKGTQDAANLAITFTATSTASGSVLVGSSREMLGFEDSPSKAVVQAVLDRAVKFLPGFASLKPQDSRTRYMQALSAFLIFACSISGFSDGWTFSHSATFSRRQTP